MALLLEVSYSLRLGSHLPLDKNTISGCSF
jgi:hypothetical protein